MADVVASVDPAGARRDPAGLVARGARTARPGSRRRPSRGCRRLRPSCCRAGSAGAALAEARGRLGGPARRGARQRSRIGEARRGVVRDRRGACSARMTPSCRWRDASMRSRRASRGAGWRRCPPMPRLGRAGRPPLPARAAAADGAWRALAARDARRGAGARSRGDPGARRGAARASLVRDDRLSGLNSRPLWA